MSIKIKISREIKIGIYAVTTLLVMYWLFNFLKGQDLLNTYDTYYATYENVEGLTQSAPVFLKGLKVGTVARISFDTDHQLFLVTMRISRGYSVPANSVAEIYGVDIMGNKAMRIVMGNSPLLAPSKSYLASAVASDFPTMVANELTPIKNKLDVLLTKLTTTVDAVNNVLDEDRQKDLYESIHHLNQTLAHIERITGAIDADKKRLSNTLENIEVFTASLRNNTQSIEAVVHNFEQISDSLKQADIKGTVQHMNTLLAQAADTTGTVGQLLYNDELYRRVSTTLSDLDALINDIKLHPKKYIKLSVF
jgi:phospholipid/cholesterol/gamma-HCH transport system substrate-binding protein